MKEQLQVARFYQSKDGKPLKTRMAAEYPLLSRRERRTLARKLARSAAKDKATSD